MKIGNEKAITIVSLIITIIIMLTLVGIVLYFSIGENGLIKISKEAAKKYQNAQKDEQEQLSGVIIGDNWKEDTKANEMILLESNCSGRYEKSISISNIKEYKNYTEDDFVIVLTGIQEANSNDATYVNKITKSYNSDTGELSISKCIVYHSSNYFQVWAIYDVYLKK